MNDYAPFAARLHANREPRRAVRGRRSERFRLMNNVVTAITRFARIPRGPSSLLGALAMLGGAGCTHVGVEQQRLVSQPNMQFDGRTGFALPTRLASQFEPGRVVSGGAQASVCAACR